MSEENKYLADVLSVGSPSLAEVGGGTALAVVLRPLLRHRARGCGCGRWKGFITLPFLFVKTTIDYKKDVFPIKQVSPSLWAAKHPSEGYKLANSSVEQPGAGAPGGG